MATRRRLDTELVRRGLAPSRARARELVSSGQVTVGGAPAGKPAHLVAAGEPVEVLAPPPPYVSRAGAKLAGALDRWELDPDGARVLDVGASTGGFTDCVLQRGAAHVVALDVGHGQLHPRIRHDPRVDVRERTDIRDLDPATVEPFDLVVVDVAFISVTKIVDALLPLLAPGGRLLILVKPQFEVDRRTVSRGKGVVTDPEVRRMALDTVIASLRDRGASIIGTMTSPVVGSGGNVEFLLLADPDGSQP